MKRIELFKKTGIYFTAIALSAAVTFSAPVVTAFASDSASDSTTIQADAVQTDALQAQADDDDEKEDDKETVSSDKSNSGSTNEVADPKPDDDDDGSHEAGSDDHGSGDEGGSDDHGGGDEGGSDDHGSGDEGGSDDHGSGDEGGSDDHGSGDEGGSDDHGSDHGSGDEGGSDDHGSGDEGSSDDHGSGSEDSGSGDSGSSSEDSGSGDSGSGSEDSGSGDSGSGSEDSGSGDSGSGSEDSGSGDSGSGSEDSGSDDSGSGSEDSGSGDNASGGNTGDSGQGGSGNTGTDTETKPVGQNDPAVTTTTQVKTTTTTVGDNTPVTIPDNKAKTKKQKGSIKDRQTQLNPGEVPTGYNDAANHNGTNEQLLANQNIVSGLGLMYGDFRFYTVKKDLAIAANAQAVHEEMKSASRQIGILSENDAMYVLSEEKDGWLYVESGTVRGFVKDKQVLRNEAADAVVADLQSKLDMLAELSGEEAEPVDAETLLTFAEETVPAGENAAFAYKRCTTKSTVIDKAYAVAESDSPILEQADEEAREIGHLYPGNIAYVILQANDKWAFVESGNVRGFTRVSNLTTGKKAKKLVQENGEANMETAEEYVSPKENEALYYSLNSVYDGVAYSNIRSEIVNIAAECIGNPYVWGGNSLTYGADCSGFVKTLYSMFGYEIPRVADAQSRYGTQIPISDAAPGDLIFFAANGYVYHVALYAGDGMTIEAYSEDRGIIATTIGNRDAVWATRVIED